MFKLSNVNNAKIGKSILFGAIILALGLGSAVAKNNHSDDDDDNHDQKYNNGNHGNQGGQVNYGSQVDPGSLLNLLFPTKKPEFDSTDYVDFSKDILNTPCLLIKNYGAPIDGTFYNVKFKQRLKSTASEWYVTSEVPEAACSNLAPINPFTPVSTSKNSTGGTIRQYHTLSTTPTDSRTTLDKTSSVDFNAELIDIRCLLVKGFNPRIDGTFYHIQLVPQLTIKNISDWKVSAFKEAPECDQSSTNLFQ